MSRRRGCCQDCLCLNLGFSGIANDNCSSCGYYNTDWPLNFFSLPRVAANHWRCIMTEPYTCDFDTLEGQVVGNELIVTLSGFGHTHQWRDDVSGFQCNGDWYTLPNVLSFGDMCDSSSSTAHARFRLDPPTCQCPQCYDAGECVSPNDPLPTQAALAVSDFVNDYCLDCEDINTTWILDIINPSSPAWKTEAVFECQEWQPDVKVTVSANVACSVVTLKCNAYAAVRIEHIYDPSQYQIWHYRSLDNPAGQCVWTIPFWYYQKFGSGNDYCDAESGGGAVTLSML